MSLLLRFLLLLALFCTSTGRVYAQEPAKEIGGEDIESLFSQDDVVDPVDLPEAREPKPSDLKELSDLVKLAPFEDVAVIQKRYLPKTGRFEFFAGPSLILNDPFFLGYGANLRLAYYFREKYGVELVGVLLDVKERGVTTDLKEKRGVKTSAIVSPKNYVGLDFKWVPIYGKMTLSNETIIPFDMYFSLGAGSTGTNQGISETTAHLGTGQIFAMGKATAIRWDLSLNMFNGRYNEEQTNGTFNQKTGFFNNLLMTVGMSFFFPEATYR